MKRFKILIEILKNTKLDKVLWIFGFFVLFSGLVFTYAEPGIQTYGDGLWYALAVFTSMGFGDFVAVTFVGRIFTFFLSMYGIGIIAIIPGILISYYLEIMQMKSKESAMEFIDELERLPELSKEELKTLSENIKNRKYKI